MSGPLTPSEVGKGKISTIPETVFEAFNAEILAQFSGRKAIVKQARVVDRLKFRGMTSEEIFSNGWLNVEEAYRAAGWKVDYDKPGYNESYDAVFEFTSRGATAE